MSLNVDEQTKLVIDMASITTVVGTLWGALPALAALFSLVWSLIRIYETKTFQGLISRFKKKD
jgi:hypothetical protein